MKILIVEDETAAAENLLCLLRRMEPEAEVVSHTESVEETVEWLIAQPAVDLIFMDVHLSDGLAFAIFEQMHVDTPIVFTTAYDQYALDAFKVNSIDYLLKPVKPEELRRALDKYHRRSPRETADWLSSLNALRLPEPRYAVRMLVTDRDRLIPVRVDELACVYSTNRRTELILRDGRSLAYARSLEQVMASLNPAAFIRANKQFIVSREAIREMSVWFDNRLRIRLCVDTPEPVYVSKNKVADFKQWFTVG